MKDYGIRGMICLGLLCVSAWGGRVIADEEVVETRIMPGDYLMIEAGEMTLKQPYYLDSRDPVLVKVRNLPGDEPIRQFFARISEGMLDLGVYGSVRVEGMTAEEATEAVTELMASFVENPEVSLSQGTIYKWRGVSGKYYVSPSGEIRLCPFVRSYEDEKVAVARMTFSEAASAVEEWLAERQVNAEVTVKRAVIRADRNYCHVLSIFEMSSHEVELAEGATVQDVLTDAKVFSWLHEGVKVEISRGIGDGFLTTSPNQYIPVDWKAILQGDLKTNYMILPSDILVITPKAMKRANF